MKSTKFRRQAEILALILAGSMFVTSCNLGSGGSDASKAIKKVVESYLDDIQSGTFTKDEYASDYADDTPFADLSFADDAVKEIMDKGLEQMTYKITDAEGTVKDEEGTCDVTVTAVDVEQVLSDLGADGMDADTLMSAITDKDAPTKDNKITLDLTYDADNKDWLVSDSGPLSEILGDPYTEITYKPDYGDPVETLDTFMTALTEADADTIALLCPTYAFSDFFAADDEDSMAFMHSYYENATYELNGDPTFDGDNANVNVTLTTPDISAIVNDMANDAEFLGDAMKPYLLAVIQGGDTDAAIAEISSAYFTEAIARMSASDSPTVTSDSVFVLTPDADAETWVMYEIPEVLYGVNSEPNETSDEVYTNATIRALEMLLADGSIDQATYDEYMSYFGAGSSLPTEGATDPNIDSTAVLNDINSYWWYDYTFSSVTSYETYTYSIDFQIVFNSSWEGLTIYYDFYNENGTVLCKSSSDTLWTDENSMYASYAMEDSSLIPADTYRVVLYLEDGTILADEYVTVTVS